MAKCILIERPNGMVSIVRSVIETTSEEPLTEHEEIINELYNKIKYSGIQTIANQFICDNCGCHPNIIYTTISGRFCHVCYNKIK